MVRFSTKSPHHIYIYWVFLPAPQDDLAKMLREAKAGQVDPTKAIELLMKQVAGESPETPASDASQKRPRNEAHEPRDGKALKTTDKVSKQN